MARCKSLAAGQRQLAQQSGAALGRAAAERNQVNSGLQQHGNAHAGMQQQGSQALGHIARRVMQNEAQLAAMQQQGGGAGPVDRAYVAPRVHQPCIQVAPASAPSNAQIADNASAIVRAHGGQPPTQIRLADGVNMGALQAAVMNAQPAMLPNATTGDLGSAMVPSVGRAIVPAADADIEELRYTGLSMREPISTNRLGDTCEHSTSSTRFAAA